MLELLAPGHVVCDRYRILGVLGKGGMGTVFKAEDTALKRLVALKVTTVRNALTDDEDDGEDPLREERFLREASLSAQIHHPNVVTVFDYGRGEHGVETFCYIAMQLLQGDTLGARLGRKPGGLPAHEALVIVTQVARGLRAAHARGLVHRDLKPENIMLTPGEDGDEIACLIDFGLAKEPGRDQHLTDVGTILGTPEYMAPEQVQAVQIDARADLYALGVVLYECLCGRPPFLSSNAFKVATMHLREEPPPLRVMAGRPEPSPALAALVKGLLVKHRDRRIQTAEEVLKRLRELPEARPLPENAAAETLAMNTVSHFQTGRKLGESSRAVVFDATHVELGRQVAIKVFRAVSPSVIARLKRELPTLAVLRHPSNARVLDVGAHSKGGLDQPFLVMERLRGPTLKALLAREGHLTWRRAASLAIGVLDGLAEAHACGIVHRHLTPEHVLVPGEGSSREHVKIISYRVADRDAESSEPLLPSLPDPAYLSPEVSRGGLVTERADLYAVGAMLHEAVLGRAPGLDRNVKSERASHAPRDLPPALVELLRCNVSLDPAERYDAATDFAAALKALLGGEISPDSGEPAPRSRRHLHSTGQPTIWLLTGDPALRTGSVEEALAQLASTARVQEIGPEQRDAWARSLGEPEANPPWLVVFGAMHAILEDPILAALARSPESARLMVSTHANAALTDAAINFCGLDHHVTLPSSAEEVRDAIDRVLARVSAARRHCDDLRMGGRRSSASSVPPSFVASS
ncbi:MAG: serine/threonine-protein kinase [Polyangiaceae bacterium]